MAVKLEAARGDFTAVGGLGFFEQLMPMLGIKKRLRDYLPGRTPEHMKSSYQKFKALTLGFVAGAECLDDMAVYAEDPGFVAFCNNYVHAPNTYGDFLRSFEVWHPRHINEVLADVALKARRNMFKYDDRFILDVDSTIHEQYAKKMEGLSWAYNKVWGLSSLQAFDQYGFQYWMDVREGSAFTANGVSTVVERVFRKIPKSMTRYLRADSGMCNLDVFRAASDNNVKFVIAMRANMFEPLVNRVKQWHNTKHTFFKDGRPAEIGSCVYHPSQFDRETLRVVFIRARKPQRELIGEYPFTDFDYRAWVTNIGEHEMKNEAVIDFYKARGNAENFIRELKNGFDMHHFPCKKLLANKIYGLIAAFAHNLMRIASWNLGSKVPHFSKTLRFRMINLAGQVVKKARYTIIRLSTHHHKEVNYRISRIQKQFSSS